MAQLKTILRKMKALASDNHMTKKWPPHRNRPTRPRIPMFTINTNTMSDQELENAYASGMLRAPIVPELTKIL